jgi:hypothetical protein
LAVLDEAVRRIVTCVVVDGGEAACQLVTIPG